MLRLFAPLSYPVCKRVQSFYRFSLCIGGVRKQAQLVSRLEKASLNPATHYSADSTNLVSIIYRQAQWLINRSFLSRKLLDYAPQCLLISEFSQLVIHVITLLLLSH